MVLLALLDFGSLWVVLLLLLAGWYVAGDVQAIIKLFVHNVLIELCQLVHQFGFVIFYLIRSAHHFLDLLLVSHHVLHVIEEILKLIHVQFFHLLLLDSRGSLQSAHGLDCRGYSLRIEHDLIYVELLILQVVDLGIIHLPPT